MTPSGMSLQEIRSPIQMRKEKQKREKNKLKHKPKLQRQAAKASKDAYLKKAAERRFQQMHTRSRMLVVNGGKRGGKHR